jgi:NADPH2:quinone reductase
MRAVVVEEFGPPAVLVARELPDPAPGAGQVLIAIEAAGVNRADVLARAGKYHRAGPPPLVLGLECAGRVVTVGAGVSGIGAGDQVLAFGATNDPGFYADRAVVPATSVVPVPDEVDPTQAACLPTAWLSAWYCLRHLAALRPGETAVIHAAASGVGSAAVQIAAAAGATVIATAGSAEKVAWARSLGAGTGLDTSVLDRDQVLDGIAAATGGRGADVVLDTVGGDTFSDSLRAAGYAGRVVAMANVALAPSVIDTRDFYPKNARILGFQITALIEHGYDPRDDLAELLAGVADGRFTVPIDATFGLADATAAHRLVESRKTRGKVVLTVGR